MGRQEFLSVLFLLHPRAQNIVWSINIFFIIFFIVENTHTIKCNILTNFKSTIFVQTSPPSTPELFSSCKRET